MRGSTAALVLCGCSFSAQQVNPDGAPIVVVDSAQPSDGAVGGVDTPATDADPGQGNGYCGGTFNRVCVTSAPTNNLILPTSINTDNSNLCVPLFTSTPSILACAIVAQSITVSSGTVVAVTGKKPLILLADTITITGTLDVSSHRGSSDGPAANASACATNAMAPGVGTKDDGGGGAGGSFGAKGGEGGDGAAGGVRGKPADTTSATFLHGGCTGATGGGAISGAGGAGGHGGGAVSLIARSSLVIDGTVDASGAAGSGARQVGGGGGGGSGGMIVLDTASVTVTGQCFANGGGAGQGASAVVGEDGHESTAPAIAGTGGQTGSELGGPGGIGGVGPGGAGAQGTKGENTNNVAFGGGGGGGGSVGVIKVLAGLSSGTNDSSKVSPNPT